MIIEVFKTNVNKINEARMLVNELQQFFPGSKINFDLQDCDKVLRIDGYNNISSAVIETLTSKGFECDELQ
jgi:hypothetical protein